MAYEQNVVDIIKNKITLLEVVQKRISIIRKGSKSIALCPFHKEKTPSFHIDTNKNLYYCFGCHASGDMFSFIQAYDNIDFKEALNRLAEMVGVDTTQYSINKVTIQANKEERRSELSILDQAKQLFVSSLGSPANSNILDYCFKRGLSEYTLRNFDIGYAQNNYSLNAHHSEELEKSYIAVGLKGQGDTGNYLFFRNRLMFPIKNKSGQTIAFGGRSLDDSNPKYLNTKDTKLFHKKNNLYGLYEGLKTFKRPQEVFLVEGYMDVLALQQEGFLALAPLGTAISVEQIQTLLKMNIPIYVCLDGDEAGRRSSLRVAYMVLQCADISTKPVKFITIPNGEDPDSFLKNNSKNSFKALIANSEYLSNFLWNNLISNIKDNSPENKILLKHSISKVLKYVNHQEWKVELEGFFQDKIQKNFTNNNYSRMQYKTNYYNNYTNKKGVKYNKINSGIKSTYNSINTSMLYFEEYMLLSCVIYCPNIYNIIDQDFANYAFNNKSLEECKQYIVNFLEQTEEVSTDLLKEMLAKNGFDTILQYISNDSIITATLKSLTTEKDFIITVEKIFYKNMDTNIEKEIQNNYNKSDKVHSLMKEKISRLNSFNLKNK